MDALTREAEAHAAFVKFVLNTKGRILSWCTTGAKNPSYPCIPLLIPGGVTTRPDLIWVRGSALFLTEIKGLSSDTERDQRKLALLESRGLSDLVAQIRSLGYECPDVEALKLVLVCHTWDLPIINDAFEQYRSTDDGVVRIRS